MTEDEFVKLVGERLFHVTMADNLPTIRAQGLLRPTSIAARAGVDPETLVLRDAPVRLEWGAHHATLNHQLPLLAGRATASEWLDGMNLEAWAAQLDQRCFFWSSKENDAFQASLEGRGDIVTLSFDSREIYKRFLYKMSLSPINSGYARRRASPRGRWLYVPVNAPLGTLKANRTSRGLVKAKDKTKEVSITDDLSVADLMATKMRQV